MRGVYGGHIIHESLGSSPTGCTGTPGQASSSGLSDPLGAMRAVIGGNNACHCIHVSELITRVGKLEANSRAVAAAFAPAEVEEAGTMLKPFHTFVSAVHFMSNSA